MSEVQVDLSETEVIIVDDIPSARKILGRILKKLGCKNIHECNNATEVLATANQYPSVGLIISDREMPDMSGLELLTILRKREGKKEIPFILISSSVSHADIKNVGEQGHAEILLKPFSSTSLSQKIALLAPVP